MINKALILAAGFDIKVIAYTSHPNLKWEGKWGKVLWKSKRYI